MLVFEERRKLEYPEKNLSSREENQQQTLPTYGVESENRSRATLVGGKCSHHYTTLLPKHELLNDEHEHELFNDWWEVSAFTTTPSLLPKHELLNDEH